jgi:taurine dioxygenase
MSRGLLSRGYSGTLHQPFTPTPKLRDDSGVREFEHVEVTPISPSIGAELSNIDLSRPLKESVVSEIEQALNRYLVLFFRDQKLTPDQHKQCAEQFGEPEPYPLVPGIEECPDIVPILKLPDEKINFGGVWHSDTAYLPAPPKAALLYAKELPTSGGDTLFANMYAAYDSLSSGMQALLSGLNAVNEAGKADIADTRVHRDPDPAKKDLNAVHPVIRTHPETGRKLLFVDRAHTTRFENMTQPESAGLLEYLFQIQIRPEFCYRFQWQPDSLAFWDNRACQHYPLNDYHGQKRLLHRISLKGEKPF